MEQIAKQGILLVNLGTPDVPTASALKPYLTQFLLDRFVLDVPFLWRWFLVKVLIVPKRSHQSAEAYQNIWTERGSPLLFHTQDLCKKVGQLFPSTPVVFGMRYGKPSLEKALRDLKAQGVNDVLMLPLYPQYSEAANRSSIDEVKKIAKKFQQRVTAIQDFYSHPAYLAAVTEVSKPFLIQPYDYVLFSYHGLPERQLKKLNSTCRCDSNCCTKITKQNSNCYRAQCYATTEFLKDRLQIPTGKYGTSFQSRLGSTPWIKPYTDQMYVELARQGKKRILVMCPSFVADCLETLEEIAMRGKEDFIKEGGEDLQLIPSLNSEDIWAQAVKEIILTRSEYEKALHPFKPDPSLDCAERLCG